MKEEMDPLSFGHAGDSVRKRVRKLKHKWTKRQTEQLISAVKKREGLWNYMSKEYRDRALRGSLWQDVAYEIGLPRSEVTIKWNCLRCSFRATFNRVRTSSKHGKILSPPNSMYAALKFLEPLIRCEVMKTTGNTLNITEYPIEDAFEVEVDEVKIEEILHSPSPSRSPGYENSPQHPSPLPSPSPSPSPPHSSSPPPAPSLLKVAKKRRLMKKADADYANVVECALQSLNATTKNDSWDDLGSFVASNGREWAEDNPQMAKEFKIAINEVVLNFQKKFAWSQ